MDIDIGPVFLVTGLIRIYLPKAEHGGIAIESIKTKVERGKMMCTWGIWAFLL